MDKFFKALGYTVLIGLVVAVGMLINYVASTMGIDLWPGEGTGW